MAAPVSPYDAIADPTRRAILDLLRDRSDRTAGEIAAQFGGLSRPAVSKHLKVLRAADLVRVEERGREWRYTLHAEPLRPVYEGWLAAYAPFWRDTLDRLKLYVEREAESEQHGEMLDER